jgi:phenylacetate-CoA ligase
MSKIWERMINSYSMNATAFKTAFYFNTFIKNYKLLKRSQWWSKARLDAYQLQQLNKLLRHTYDNVPYYRRLFDGIGVKPESIKDFEDLQKLPFLTKETIRENAENLRATNYPAYRFEYTRTGGSTGFPLHFYKEGGVWITRLMAYNKIMLEWAGISFLDRCAFITGYHKPWDYQLLGRMLVLSSFHMDEQHMPTFVEKIRKLKPDYVLTYPSAITILAQYIKKNNLEIFPNLKAIVSHAETLYDWQRDLLEETFRCRVHNQYGLREQTVLGATCECSNYLHMFPEYGIFELIDKNGKPVKKEGEIGEIVGTGFHTYLSPFIRYKCGDLGIYTKKKCECGRNYPLLKNIEGRTQDFVVSKLSQLVPFTRIQHLVAESTDHVIECQFYQDTEGEIVLKLVKTQNYNEVDGKAIRKKFQSIFGEDFNLTTQFVDYIPRTARGKYQFLIQKLPIKFGL